MDKSGPGVEDRLGSKIHYEPSEVGTSGVLGFWVSGNVGPEPAQDAGETRVENLVWKIRKVCQVQVKTIFRVRAV